MSAILVIDDDPSICDVVAKILTASGYVVTAATSAQAGLEVAARQSFDVAIVDLVMPDVSGFDVIRLLRARAPALPLIMMSGLLAEPDGYEPPDFIGMAGLRGIPRLGKPFRREELVGLVARSCAGTADAVVNARAAV